MLCVCIPGISRKIIKQYLCLYEHFYYVRWIVYPLIFNTVTYFYIGLFYLHSDFRLITHPYILDPVFDA